LRILPPRHMGESWVRAFSRNKGDEKIPVV
jgi:hypothetical protein